MPIHKSVYALLLLLFASIQSFAQNRVITGRILSEKNTPIGGATILVNHSKKAIAAMKPGVLNTMRPGGGKHCQILNLIYATAIA